MRLLALLLAGLLGACVAEDTATGKPIPRGNQRFPFEEVEARAERLAVGMTRTEVLLLLGSAAEMKAGGDEWIWLPERYAIIVPARFLRVRFEGGRVADFGYEPIVLGMEL